MNGMDEHFGLAANGSFVLFTEKKGVPASMRIELRLTSLPMQAALPPESEQLDLAPHEGRVLLVRGHLGGAWMYSAEIVEVAGPILSHLAVRLLG